MEAVCSTLSGRDLHSSSSGDGRLRVRNSTSALHWKELGVHATPMPVGTAMMSAEIKLIIYFPGAKEMRQRGRRDVCSRAGPHVLLHHEYWALSELRNAVGPAPYQSLV